MARTMRGVVSAAGLVCFCALAFGENLISNWSAPPYWSAPVRVRVAQGSRASLGTQAAEALPTTPVPFVGIVPCRIVDTRGNGFTGAYGPPALGGNAAARAFDVPAGPCPGIPADAAAFSINIAAILPAADGFLTAFPTGSAQPNASTLNFLAGEVIANSAVIGAGTSGSISVFVNVTTDVIIDINGYYAGSVVTRLNTLSGDVTLAPGSNVSITPSGQTQTVAATGGPGGVLPTGTVSQTLRHNGTSWVATNALLNNEAVVEVTVPLALPGSGQILSSGENFIHRRGFGSAFLGNRAGDSATPGDNNTGVGAAVTGGVASSAECPTATLYRLPAVVTESGLPQYGLIAEEVAEIYPELVVYDEEGRPEAIRSQLLQPLFLNELQKQRRIISEQRTELDELRARLAQLESLVRDGKE